MKERKVEDSLQNTKTKLKAGIRNNAYDLIAVLIILVLFAVSLGILERRIITADEVLDVIVESIPFFLTAVLLSNTYYSKGVAYGKLTDRFNFIVDTYSNLVNVLDGKKIEALPDFCDEYNAMALRKMQIAELRRMSITWEQFNDYHISPLTGEKTSPLKHWSYKELKKNYGKAVAKCVHKAKQITIKGIQSNILLSSNDSNDITDLGKTEKQLKAREMTITSITFLASIALMTLVIVKDFEEWGWAGIVLVVFKVVYIFCRAFTTYFDGYDDVTVQLSAHLNRKIDILKQFQHWFDKNICKINS